MNVKLSTLYGKKTQNAKGERGYVLCVYREENKISGLLCADANENEFFIPAENIKNTKIKIDYSVSGAIKGEPLRLGKPAFDCAGGFLGYVTEIIAENNTLSEIHIGNKKISATHCVCGDALLVKSSARIVISDVKSNGRVIIKRGTPLTVSLLEKAQKKGEYIQANLKTIT